MGRASHQRSGREGFQAKYVGILQKEAGGLSSQETIGGHHEKGGGEVGFQVTIGGHHTNGTSRGDFTGGKRWAPNKRRLGEFFRRLYCI
jgi:hypothetical protein